MEKNDFVYKKKPAVISFLLTYCLCFGISYLLIDNSPFISREITKQVVPLIGVPRIKEFLSHLPYGIILAVPFVIYGIRTLLGNLMGTCEITPSEIRLLTGRLIRKEQYVSMMDVYDISFRQSLIEAPFRVGSLIVKTRGRGEVVIEGVYNVKKVVERLRKQAG